eukprot:TRINITY_DN2786_c0_g1_i6.p1 TRINITY_DN2786_c0_g1~~TRINITY_DN2786_c0_g1_i6.p1  ORF type:complete len:399 (-),score=45.36 TRINITY_DN2786_c0_g1_i6:853-2049(-)
MAGEYPLPDGEKICDIIYSDEAEYILHTENYQIIGYICEDSGVVKTIAKDFGYFKTLRRILNIFAKPVKVCIAAKGNAIQIQQIFKKYEEAVFDYSSLSELMISSMKALNIVNSTEFIIHPQMMRYRSNKKEWRICLVRNQYKEINATMLWLLSISHILIKSTAQLLFNDIKELQVEMSDKKLKPMVIQKVLSIVSKGEVDKRVVEALKSVNVLDNDLVKVAEKLEAKLKLRKSVNDWTVTTAESIVQKTNYLNSNKDESDFAKKLRNNIFDSKKLEQVLQEFRKFDTTGQTMFTIDENSGCIHIEHVDCNLPDMTNAFYEILTFRNLRELNLFHCILSGNVVIIDKFFNTFDFLSINLRILGFHCRILHLRTFGNHPLTQPNAQAKTRFTGSGYGQN